MSSEPFLFNPLDPAVRDDPFPWYARGRREQPVHRHMGLPLLSIFRYDDVQAILRDNATWSSDLPLPSGFELPADDAKSMLVVDPPEHTRLRGLVNQAFTPRRIQRLEARIREIAHQLLDRALDQARVDLVAALTYPLPVIVIAEMIGVPAEDRDQFKVWSDEVVQDLGAAVLDFSRERFDRQIEIRRAIGGYFARLVDERRSEPRDDLLSALVAAEEAGSKLSFPELISMLILLLVAGNETTTNLIGNTAVQLLDHPGTLERLRRDPARVPAAIEEVLRFDSPVQATVRRAAVETSVAGETIAPGETAFVWIGSANHDELAFEAPDRFDIDRDPNRHLSFGFGAHYCLGANLARLEARVAIETLLERATFRRAAGDVERTTSFILRGIRRLPVELSAR